MARSHGHVAAAAVLGALCYALVGELAAFVNTAASSRSLRSRVSLAATQADVNAAKKDFELKKWAAGHLAKEGSAQAAAAAAKAQQAEAAYVTLKAQLDGQAPPPVAVAPAPVAAAPVAAAPVAAAAPASAVSKEDLAAVKQSAQLLSWAANKLASEGAPQAAAMKVKADQAVAAFEAMKQAQASGAAMPAVPAPVAAAPVAAAPVAAAPVASAVSKEDLAAAKQNAQLLAWSANKLASEGAPQAAAMKVRADQAAAAFEALKQAQASGAVAPAVPAPVAAAAPAMPAPVAAAPAISSAPSREEVEKAKKEMELHEWAAKSLAASGSLQAAVMKAKAEQSRQIYEALKENQLVSR